MSRMSTEDLVDTLATIAAPVRPLGPPLVRALATLTLLIAGGALFVWLGGDQAGLLRRYSGREWLMVAEMAAMAATAVLAIAGAFALAIPGESRRWLAAPLPPFLAWVGLSGLGCYQDLLTAGPAGLTWGHALDCLAFLLAASLPIVALTFWRLSRARPIEPLPVALLAGLGAAALAALLLQFFHPFALTLLDLIVHFGSVLAIAALAAMFRRRVLAPAAG